MIALDQAQTMRATLDQVDDVIDTEEDAGFAAGRERSLPAVLRGELRLRGVSFG